MKERDINFLILNYLRKKGLDDTAQVFSHQCKLDEKKDDVVSLNHQLDSDNALDDLLFTYAAENDPQRFVDSFDQLVAWVDSSLDLYKAELQRVLYPVFVHIYLQLVQYGASNTAADLLKRYRRRLVEVGGRASSVRAQELTELQSVAVAQHLEVNPFAKAARAQRSTLVLCTYSFELLMHHLQGSKQWLILNIVNQHIRFELHEGLPYLDTAVADEEGAGLLQGRAGHRASDTLLHEGLPYLDTAVADEEGAGLLQGRAGHEAGAINSTPLDLGLLRDGVEDQFADKKLQDLQEEEKKATQAATAAAVDDFGDMMDDGMTGMTAGQQAQQAAQKRSKQVKERAITAAKQKQKDILDTRRMPMIPLLGYHEKQRARLSADLDHRTTVNPTDRLPSCCFFTVLNGNQTLTTLTTSPDTKQVAAGFSDSMIRVYNLAGLAKQRGVLSKRVREQGLAPPVAGKRKRGTEDGMDVDLEEEELQEELEDMSQRQTVNLVGHSGTVNALAYSADQQLLFSASSDATVRLWSTELKKGLAAYRGHVYPVWDVAASPHGTYLVSGGSDRTARLWSTEHIHALRIFAGHQSDVDVVAWHPNSHYIATGSSDRTVRLWDVHMGSCCRLMSAQTSCVTSLAFSPDGRQLAAGTEDGSIAVYDLGSARRMALLEGHEGPVWSMSYSRGCGNVLATGGADRTVRLYSMPKGDNVLEAINEELAAAAAAEALDVGAAAAGRSAAAAAGRVAGMAGAAAGSGLGHNVAHNTAAHWQPYQLVKTFTTRATPVIDVEFSPRNLLLAGGPWALQPVDKPQGKRAK